MENKKVETQEVHNTEKSTIQDEGVKTNTVESTFWKKEFDSLIPKYQSALKQIKDLEEIKLKQNNDIKAKELSYNDLNNKYLETTKELKRTHIEKLFTNEGGDSSKLKYVMNILGNKTVELKDEDLVKEFQGLRNELPSLFKSQEVEKPIAQNVDTQKTASIKIDPQQAVIDKWKKYKSEGDIKYDSNGVLIKKMNK